MAARIEMGAVEVSRLRSIFTHAPCTMHQAPRFITLALTIITTTALALIGR